MNKKSLIFSFIFFIIISLSIASAVNDSNQDEKISFGKWLKGLWGKITGRTAEITGKAEAEPSPGCTDSDGGINYTIKGTTQTSTNSLTDNCINATSLREYYCYTDPSSESATPGIFNVPYICTSLGSQYICQNGACKTSRIASGNSIPIIPIVSNPCDSLTPNFIISSQKCLSNDVFEINWTDVNNCALDYTQKSTCDYNGNNLFCEFSPGIKDIGIGGNLINVSGNYSGIGVQFVELAQLGGGGVDFNWNFSNSPLNFCNIGVKVADSSDAFGYTIVKNISVSNKTIWVERLNNSGKVCVKDIPEEILISDFSSNCTNSNEILLSCPGLKSGYNCEIVESDSSSWFKVWPLNHSAVKEIISLAGIGTGAGACTENWNCTEWSNLTGQCGTKTCEDLNDCGTIIDKPFETQTCGEECSPIWTCTSFGKCADGTKERICTDSNNCGVETDKPNETSGCKKISPLLIILVSVGLILIALLILYFIKRKNSKKEPSDEEQISSSASPPSSPRPPSQTNVYTPKPQYAQPQLAPRY